MLLFTLRSLNYYIVIIFITFVMVINGKTRESITMPVQRIKLSQERSKAIRNELPRGSYSHIATAMEVDVETVREILRGRIYDNHGVIPAAEKYISNRKQLIQEKVNKL
jgi:hypothetical protein